MSITATNNPYPTEPESAPIKLDRGGYTGNAQNLDEKITANFAEVKALIETYKGSKDLGSITPTSVPSTAPADQGPAFWRATQNGVYTYFGGFTVPANYFAIFSRDVNGVFSVSMTALDLTQYAKTTDVFILSNLFNYSDTTNWNEAFGGGYFYSHYINVKGFTHIYASIQPNGYWYFYDENKVLITNTVGPVNNIAVPVGSVYFRFLQLNTEYATVKKLTVSDKPAPVSGKPFGYVFIGKEDVLNLKTEVSALKILTNNLILSNLFNYSDTTNWNEAFGGGYFYSHYINVKGFTHIYASIQPNGYWYFYDENKVLITNTVGPVNNIAVPVGSVYFRFLQLNTEYAIVEKLTVSDKPAPVSGKPFGYFAAGVLNKNYLEEKKYVALGDSITDGDGSGGYTWFHFLLDASNSRGKSVDFSESGQCLRTMADKLTSINMAEADRVFVFGGTNEVGNFTLGAITDVPTPDVRKPTTVYNVGDRVSGGTKEAHGWVTPLFTFNQKYRCAVGGTSGSGEPTGFNTSVGASTVDGSVTWVCEGANTWYGDMWRVASKIWGLNPSTEIIWFIPIRTKDYEGASQDFNSIKFNNIAIFCDYNGIKYIDMRKEFPLNKLTKNAIMTDALHPNLAGQKLIFNALMRNL